MKNTHTKRLAAVLLAAVFSVQSANASDDNPNSPLNRVLRAAINSSAALQTVLAEGISVNVTDNDGETALMEAADRGNLQAVRNLISAGADVNAKDEDGETALMVAADDGHTAIVQALIAAGADVNARDDEGESALDKARDERRRSTIDALRAAGAR